MDVILDRRRQETQKKAAYERELSKVPIKKEDVDVIVRLFDPLGPLATAVRTFAVENI
jgi:hypothetical protein